MRQRLPAGLHVVNSQHQNSNTATNTSIARANSVTNCPVSDVPTQGLEADRFAQAHHDTASNHQNHSTLCCVWMLLLHQTVYTTIQDFLRKANLFMTRRTVNTAFQTDLCKHSLHEIVATCHILSNLIVRLCTY